MAQEIVEQEGVEQEVIGLHAMSTYLDKVGEEYFEEYRYSKAEEKWILSAEIGNACSMMNLAILYEREKEPQAKIEEWYKKAIEHGDDDRHIAAYNFADYYKSIGDYPNMIRYYTMAIELGNDIESMFQLAVYYQPINDYENTKKYYLMAINNMEPGHYSKVMSHFNALQIVKMLESATEDEINKAVAAEHVRYLHTFHKSLNIYKNKIALFTKLNHVMECGICYEDNKLHIDLLCAHCVCIDCYTVLHNKPCPFCRM